MPFKDPEVNRTYKRLQKRRLDAAGRQRLWEARSARIAGRQQAAVIDLAWAAGHFEGEGTISLSTHGTKNRSTRVIVCLASTDKQTIDWFQSIWPGCMRSVQPTSKNDNARRAYIWTLNASEPVECFLRDVQPYLHTDRVRAKAALAIEDILDRMPYRWNAEAHARSVIRRAEMKRLNHRGRDGQTVSERIGPELQIAQREGRMPRTLMLEGPKP